MPYADGTQPNVGRTPAAAAYLMVGQKAVHPLARTEARLTFLLPTHTGTIRICSQGDAPSENGGKPGLSVTGIVLKGGDIFNEIPADHPMLQEGWLDFEQADGRIWRRTDGAAVLPDTFFAEFSGPFVMEVGLCG